MKEEALTPISKYYLNQQLTGFLLEAVLCTDPRVLHMLGRCSITEIRFSPPFTFYFERLTTLHRLALNVFYSRDSSWTFNPPASASRAAGLQELPATQGPAFVFGLLRQCLCVALGCPEIHYVVQAALKLKRAAWLCFPSAVIKGMHHHTWPLLCFWNRISKSRLCQKVQSARLRLLSVKIPKAGHHAWPICSCVLPYSSFFTTL